MMTYQTFPMTEEGFEKIQQELHDLETVQRKNAKERIQKGRSFCDFNEDPEFKNALEHLSLIEERIKKLRLYIQHAEIVQQNSPDKVVFGSTVTIREYPDEEEEVYTIVGSEEADPEVGKISNHSQVAQELLGARVKDKVTIQTPGGERHVQILHIS